MNYEHAQSSWRADHCLATGLSADDLRDLAGHCEAAPASAQPQVFRRVLRLLAPWCERGTTDDWLGRLARIEMLIGAQAFETAAIELFPTGTVYTGGRLTDASYIAQVLVAPDRGSHSRHSATLANAWLSALLRSLARVIEEG